MIGDQRGQSLVELVALTPIVLLCGLLGMQALAAGANRVQADNALAAGAVAKALGHDPEAAAQRALPGWSRGNSLVRVAGGQLKVRLEPRAFVPGMAGLLAVDVSTRLPR